MIKVLFICHGNICRFWKSARKIKGLQGGHNVLCQIYAKNLVWVVTWLRINEDAENGVKIYEGRGRNESALKRSQNT